MEDEPPRKELVKPTLEREQLCVIRSVLKQVKQFEGLSNFARMDIAQAIVAKQGEKGNVLIDRTKDEGVHIYVLVEGRIKIFTNDKKFEEFMAQCNKEKNEGELKIKQTETKIEKVCFGIVSFRAVRYIPQCLIFLI